MSSLPVEIILSTVAVWLLVLTIVFILFYRFLKRLTKGSKAADVKRILDQILKTQKDNKKELIEVNNKIRKMITDGKFHIQKVGLIRFNPFRETGGDHSFSLAVLDDQDTGFVLTGLHTRERTRIYIKPVKNGNSELELSGEEKKALTKALKTR